MLKKLLIIVASIAATVPMGCSFLPTVDAREAKSSQTIVVTDNKNQRVERSIAGVADDENTDRGALLQHHLQYMAARTTAPLTSGNQVELLIDGPQAYKAMFAAMERARNHINLEVYILEDDEIGKALLNVLVRKQREGVQVNLIYDSLGCLTTPTEIFEILRDAGAKVFEFNPSKGQILKLNNRDHRKILVVDGTVGFTGGINISSVYSQSPSGNRFFKKKVTAESVVAEQAKQRARAKDAVDKKEVSDKSADDKNASEKGPDNKELADHRWRDTQIEVRGPAVAELQKIFFATWDMQNEEDRQPRPGLKPNYFPTLKPQGRKYVEAIASSAADQQNIIYVDLLTAIQHAQRSVHLTMAYFSPDSQTIEALQNAALKGVDVELVLPGFSDNVLIFEAGRSHYSPLLKTGVKIYERHDALLHAKTAAIDGVWSTVGSSNMDMRSFLHNQEVNLIVLGDDFGAEMEAMFQNDIADAEAVTMNNWDDRSLSLRIKQWFSRIWSYWL